MDSYLVQHIHIVKVMPKLKCKNYNINLIKILRVYEEFVFKILAGMFVTRSRMHIVKIVAALKLTRKVKVELSCSLY
jgi:hypothetical protein